MLNEYFYFGDVPVGAVGGTYDWSLVFLSYIVATLASYIALDMAGRLRDENNTYVSSLCWLLGGSFAMGAGIWSMHFIGMLAFKMSMAMSYNVLWTAISMIVAIIASLIALSLLMGKTINILKLFMGGLVLGIAIAAMHYTGMYAMTDTMIIRYEPRLFALSLLIAVIAAETALWLAIKSNKGVLQVKMRLKMISAFVMGAAICGMHYTGMQAAIFLPIHGVNQSIIHLDPGALSLIIASITFLIMGTAFALSMYKEFANQQVIATARLAGMAEVSTSVLHSVGNVLNSLNISVISIGEIVENSKITELHEVSDLLEKNKHNLVKFMMDDSKGKKIPEYLQAMSEYWEDQQVKVLTETKSALSNIHHIKEIISTQQSFGGLNKFEQILEIESVVNDAINIVFLQITAGQIKLVKEFSKITPFMFDKIKLMQIVVNLLKNAKDSLSESNNKEKIIKVTLHSTDNNDVVLQVIDNGVGINPKNLIQIFTYGFTTKESGHGYGLHSSSILAKQMGGSLEVESLGEEKGAIFSLTLPHKNVRD